MANKPKYIARCPCCKTVVDERELQQVFNRKRNGIRPSIFLEYEYHFWESYENGFKNWVCDDCIIKGKAIKSDISKQLFVDYLPHFAYYDKTKNCETCGDEFIFTKTEQQYWYETLQFWVQAKCVNCKKCYQLRKLKTELSKLLEDKSKMSLADFDRVIEIYHLLGKVEKSKEYLALKSKLKS